MTRHTWAMTLFLAALSGTACSSSKTYVMVHGAWMDARAWEQVTPLLEASGHRVVAVNLPAHGTDTATTASLAQYTDAVTAAIAAQDGPVILVGHSMGGTVISQAAEAVPEKIERLVYVAAYLLPSGQSLYATSMTDAESQLGAYLLPQDGGASLAVKPEAMAAVFCPDCSADVQATLVSRLRAEPVTPLGTPVMVTPARGGSVPRTYVRTTADRVVGPALQQRMIDAAGVEQVLSLDTGHAPFLSQPAALAELLLGL